MKHRGTQLGQHPCVPEPRGASEDVRRWKPVTVGGLQPVSGGWVGVVFSVILLYFTEQKLGV